MSIDLLIVNSLEALIPKQTVVKTMFGARCDLCVMKRVVNTENNIPAVMETVFEWM